MRFSYLDPRHHLARSALPRERFRSLARRCRTLHRNIPSAIGGKAALLQTCDKR